eukprot:gb/GECG01000955.1/.p1 GENE.gb/GECG01000955.1/~~gb/GECG01000955.1/.p1  ORF type:complete len:899 (+),score=110.22 gb/GECG01000955.1/:1-2697(+)
MAQTQVVNEGARGGYRTPVRPQKSAPVATHSGSNLEQTKRGRRVRNIRSFRRRLSAEQGGDDEIAKPREKMLLCSLFKDVDPLSLPPKPPSPRTSKSSSEETKRRPEVQLLKEAGLSGKEIEALREAPRPSCLVKNNLLTETGKPNGRLRRIVQGDLKISTGVSFRHVAPPSPNVSTFFTSVNISDHEGHESTEEGEKDSSSPVHGEYRRSSAMTAVPIQRVRGLWSNLRATMPFDITLGPKAIGFLRKKLMRIFMERKRRNFLARGHIPGRETEHKHQPHITQEEIQEEEEFRRLIKLSVHDQNTSMTAPEAGIERDAEMIASVALSGGSSTKSLGHYGEPPKSHEVEEHMDTKRVPTLQLQLVDRDSTPLVSHRRFSARSVALAAGVKFSPRSIETLERYESSRSNRLWPSAFSARARISSTVRNDSLNQSKSRSNELVDLDPASMESPYKMLESAYEKFWQIRETSTNPIPEQENNSPTFVRRRNISEHVEFVRENSWVQAALALRVQAYKLAQRKLNKENAKKRNKVIQNRKSVDQFSPERAKDRRQKWFEQEKQKERLVRDRNNKNVEQTIENREDFLMRNDWFLEKRLERERQCLWMTAFVLQKSVYSLIKPLASRRYEWRRHAAAACIQVNWKTIRNFRRALRKLHALTILAGWAGRVKLRVRVRWKNRSVNLIKAFMEDFCLSVNEAKTRVHIRKFLGKIVTIQRVWRFFSTCSGLRMQVIFHQWKKTLLRLEELSQSGGIMYFGQEQVTVVPLRQKEAFREFRKFRQSTIESVRQTGQKLALRRMKQLDKYKLLLQSADLPAVSSKELGVFAGILTSDTVVNGSLRTATVSLMLREHCRLYARSKKEAGGHASLRSLFWRLTHTSWLLSWMMQAYYVATILKKEGLEVR